MNSRFKLIFLIFLLMLSACSRSNETDPRKESTMPADAETTAQTVESTPSGTVSNETDPRKENTMPTDAETTVQTVESTPSETIEKSSYFDTLYANGKALDADELKKLASFLENDYQPLPWAFLGQAYRDPSEIDVIDLFYNWTEELSGEAEQEAAWKAGHLGEWRLETQKRTAKGMNEAFRKYTGKDLTKEQTDAFSKWVYLPEYDAYYSFLTDMMPQGAELGRACYLDEKDAVDLGLKAGYEQLIALEWYTLDEGARDETGMLLLVPVEDSWQIVANIFDEKPTTETDPAPTEPSAELPAEPKPVPAACTTVLLEGRATKTGFGVTNYDETGVAYYDAMDGFYTAPSDFAVISENDIVILDRLASRLQRYKDGKYFETISLPSGAYCQLCMIGEKAYVMTSDSLVTVDLNTKEQTTIPLPNPEGGAVNFFGNVLVSKMLEQDGKLYFITGEFGNYCLNEETREIESVGGAVPYSAASRNGDDIRVKKGDRTWSISAKNHIGDVIGFGEDGILYFYLFNERTIPGSEGSCRILKCTAGNSNATVESLVDVSKWIHNRASWCYFAKVAPDGSVYVLALYEDTFTVYKLKVGYEYIREQ